jgi:hypothetical protein
VVMSAVDEGCLLDVGEIGGVSLESLPFHGWLEQLRFEKTQPA